MELNKEQIESNQEKLTKRLTSSRLDLNNPDRPQDTLNADDVLVDDEDENTLAKSIIDEIIEETESAPQP